MNIYVVFKAFYEGGFSEGDGPLVMKHWPTIEDIPEIKAYMLSKAKEANPELKYTGSVTLLNLIRLD